MEATPPQVDQVIVIWEDRVLFLWDMVTVGGWEYSSDFQFSISQKYIFAKIYYLGLFLSSLEKIRNFQLDSGNFFAMLNIAFIFNELADTQVESQQNFGIVGESHKKLE